jgi:sugar lactone lactonase YvrE
MIEILILFMTMHVLLGFAFLIVALATPNLRAQKLLPVAGGGTELVGMATNCRVKIPFAIDIDRAGNMYIAEMAGGERVLKVDSRGQLIVLAGTGEKGDSGDGGPASQARFNGMHSLVIGPKNDLYIADTWNNRVRRIDLNSGMVESFAGSGRRGFSGDGGSALRADFGNVYCVAFDSKRENLYLADLDNRRIRAVNLKNGIARTVAGNGERGIPSDGSKATSAPLVDPRAVALDSKGNLYILERSGHALRSVDPDGNIRTVAGTGKKGSADGDALNASFNGPKHLCVDSNDNVIIADTDNHSIRKYLPQESKVISLAATSATSDGTRRAALNQPHGVYVEKTGTLYIADSLNDRVLKIQN